MSWFVYVCAAFALFVLGIVMFVERKARLINKNKFVYKSSGGVEKVLGLLWNEAAKRALFFKIQAKLGFRKPLTVGSPAPDGDVVSLDGKTTTLLEHIGAMPPSVPLIINIGSYNWGQFITNQAKVTDICQTYCQEGPAPLAKMLTVYIQEGNVAWAHMIHFFLFLL